MHLCAFPSSIHSIHNLAGELAPSSNLRTIKDKNPRHDSQESTKATKKRARTLESHGAKHLRREEREGASEQVSAETLRGKSGARVAVVGVCQVVEDCEVDAENSHGRTANSKSWQNPVVAGERGPAEPEAADGE